MSHAVPTVRVVSPASDENPHGFIVINKSDVAESHELFVEPGTEPVADKPARKPKA